MVKSIPIAQHHELLSRLMFLKALDPDDIYWVVTLYLLDIKDDMYTENLNIAVLKKIYINTVEPGLNDYKRYV